MTYEELLREIKSLNEISSYQYKAYKYSRQTPSNHYNDRKIQIFIVNDGEFKKERRLILLFEIHDHKFGAINSTSNYMGVKHEDIFLICLRYVLQRRSDRAPLTDWRFKDGTRNFAYQR